MFARRLITRARPFSTQPQRKNRILQTVGRVTLVSVVAGPFPSSLPTPLIFPHSDRHALLHLPQGTPSRPTAPIRPGQKDARRTRQWLGCDKSTQTSRHPGLQHRPSLFFSPLFFLTFRLDRHQSKELFPLYPSPPLCRSRYTRPTFHPTAYVHSVILSLSLISPIATRFITRHKAREVAVIEAEATDVDVRPFFPLIHHASALPSPSTRPSLLQVLSFLFHPSSLILFQTRPLSVPSSQPTPYIMTISYTPSGQKHRLLASPA